MGDVPTWAGNSLMKAIKNARNMTFVLVIFLAEKFF
jgi:hypothetical protein